MEEKPEPVFVGLSRSRGIDSQPGGPVRQPYLWYRPARQHTLAEWISRNRFLGYINVLQIRALFLKSDKAATITGSYSRQIRLQDLHKPVLKPVLKGVKEGGSQCSKFSHDCFRIVFSVNVAVLHEPCNKKSIVT
jgi:hypothetical protein